MPPCILLVKPAAIIFGVLALTCPKNALSQLIRSANLLPSLPASLSTPHDLSRSGRRSLTVTEPPTGESSRDDCAQAVQFRGNRRRPRRAASCNVEEGWSRQERARSRLRAPCPDAENEGASAFVPGTRASLALAARTALSRLQRPSVALVAAAEHADRPARDAACGNPPFTIPPARRSE